MTETDRNMRSASVRAPVIAGAPQCLWAAEALLGEGTLWSVREQALYWVDILGHLLHRYHPATQSEDSWPFDEEISAVAERAVRPGLLVTLRRGFAFFDPASGRLQPLHEPEPERGGNRFNDGKCDAQGRFWGGTMDFDCRAPTGALYRFTGGRECTRMADGYTVTNGPAWSPDGRTMYFNDTVRGEVHAFDFDAAQGTLSGRRVWLAFDAAGGLPDGMTTDAAGRLWIARWGGACVSCHEPATGAELARIALPASQITNCAFGGPGLSTLFITSARTGLTPEQLEAEPLAGGLFSVETGSPGLPAPVFAG